MRATSVVSALLAALVALGAIAIDGSEARAAIDLRRVDSSLVDLPFGGDMDAVASWVRARLERSYAARMNSALEANERSQLRARLDREVFEFRSRVTNFDGHRTGYEVSIIAGEFMVGTNESLLVLREDQTEHYFFFANGVFWKYARSLRPTTPFANRVAAQARKLYKPDTMMTGRDGKGQTRPTRALWQDKRLTMRLWDRRVLYGNDLMLIEHVPSAETVTQVRGGSQQVDARGDIDPELESFLLGDGEDEEELLRKTGGRVD